MQRRSGPVMKRILFGVIALLACGSVLEPNTDLGLRVYATVSVPRLSRSNPADSLRIRVLVSNPSNYDLTFSTGSPLELLKPLPGKGTTEAYRIANAEDSVNAGPAADAWNGASITIPAHTTYHKDFDAIPRMSDWLMGWAVPLGIYRVRSFFLGREGAVTTFEVVP